MNLIKLITLTFLYSFSIYAQENSDEKNKEATKEEIVKPQEEKIAKEPSTSIEHRQGKRFSATLDFGGSYSTYGYGISLSLYLDKNQVLELSFFEGDDSDLSATREELKALSISSKLYSGNSFYVKPGIFFVNYSYDNDALISNSDFYTILDLYRIDRKDIGLAVSIGNQWQWKNFTLGVDWIGLEYALVNLSLKKEGTGFSSLSKNEKRWFSLTALKLSFGFAF